MPVGYDTTVEYLSVDPREVAQLRGAGGERFTAFCNAVIREMARVSAIPSAAIADMWKVNIPDGGVDTHVAQASASDPSGYLTVPTCWQFKATSSSDLSDAKLEKELEPTDAHGNPRYVADLIRAGAGYRFCIADEIAADRKNEIAAVLEAAKRNINPDAPPVRVLTASDLAAQAERFPAIVIRFFRQLPALLHMDAWATNATAETKTYVPVEDWSFVRASIENHVNFGTAIDDPVYVVAGDPGLGKTRLVFETLNNAGAGGLVLHTSDEAAATNVATILANDVRLNAILVVDDCTLETKAKVHSILRGHAARVRVIVIEPYGERLALAENQPKLEEMPDATLDAVLTANFPGVAKDRRDAYRKLAGGYVRFAIGLCRDDGLIMSSGIHAGLGSVDEYLHRRLTEADERDAVHAIALVVRVGFVEEVREELETLCKFLDLNPTTVKQAAIRSKERPGFIVRGGRYLYLSPAVVANSAFRAAWKRWAADDPTHFLSRVPPPLLRTFLRRVERSGDATVREVVGKFFFDRTAAFEPGDLADPAVAQLLATLVSAEPTRYLPLLRKKIEDADSESVAGITGEYRGTQAPRRTFVWLAQRLIAFPEFFHDAERILLKLALHESEPGIGNNATALWVQLFRIFLSGTATPFNDRIDLLRQHVFSADEQRAALAARALAGVFNPWASRQGVDLVFADRIAPEEWRPVTHGDLGDCYESATSLLRDMISSGRNSLRSAAKDIVVGKAWFFLTNGLFKQLVSLVEMLNLDEANRKTLFARSMDLLLRNDDREDEEETPENLEAIRAWANSLVPETLHGRIVRFIATRGSLAIKEADAAPIVEQLAADLIADSESFDAELPQLLATTDYLGDLGFAIGKKDSDAIHAETIITRGLREPNTFVRGYLAGLLNEYPQHSALANLLLDAASDVAPANVIDLAMTGGRRTRVLDRALAFVRRGDVPVSALAALRYGVAGEELSLTEVADVLEAMLSAPADETGASEAAMGVIGYFVGYRKQRDFLEFPTLRDITWRVIESLAVGDRDAVPYDWSVIVRALAEVDPPRAIKAAVNVLLSMNLYAKQEAERILIDLASSHPDDVLNILGSALLGPGDNIAPLVHTYTSIVRGVGDDRVIAWVQAHGLEGARAIARHLPQPFIDDAGNPVVPAMTAFVLREFEADDGVYQAFYSGTHNLRFYVGDIARHHESEAAVADRFLSHQLRRIREWAQDERESALHKAAWFRRREEEDFVE